MIELSLLMICWGADPFALQRSERPAVLPATLARPTATLAQPPAVCAFSTATIADPHVPSTWIKRWELATQLTPPIIRAQREAFRRRLRDEYNEHTAAAVEQLVGHVNERRLLENFDWRIAVNSVDHVCLEATPRDQTERLFYGSIRVSLHPMNGAPETICVINRNQVERIVWQAGDSPDKGRVQLVQFEEGIPPAPSETIRTANSRVVKRK